MSLQSLDQPHPRDSEAGKELEPPVAIAADAPPDGGLRAWLTVAAVFWASFVAFGIGPVWGIYQDAYLSRPDSPFHGAGAFNLGFVGGLSVGCGFLLGPFSNLLVSRFGVRTPVLLGVLLMALGLELASIATRYWELLLSQGVMFGLGVSFVYLPMIGLPAQWFDKRRGLAMGIATTGSAVGVIVFSPLVQALVARLSIEWALRITGLIAVAVGALAALLAQQRVAVVRVQYRVFDARLLRVPGFVPLLGFQFLQFFAYSAGLFFIPSYCAAIHVSASQAAGVLSVQAACNAAGRVLAGLLADRLGAVNVLLVGNAMAGVVCLVVWLFAESLGVMFLWAVLWGFFCGGYWSLGVPITAKLVGMERLGSALAIQFLMNVLPPTFATPIGSKIIEAGGGLADRAAFRWVIVWVGLMSIVAAACLIPVRLALTRRLLVKV